MFRIEDETRAIGECPSFEHFIVSFLWEIRVETTENCCRFVVHKNTKTFERNLLYSINTNEIPGEFSHGNKISSHVKRCHFTDNGSELKWFGISLVII